MRIIQPRDQPGASVKKTSQFEGKALPFAVMPPTDGVTITIVTFEPCARTHWHRHENGQILQVIAGRGRIQSRGGEIEVLAAGDTVWVPPNEEHWHGASEDEAMTHTAISLGQTIWLDPVD